MRRLALTAAIVCLGIAPAAAFVEPLTLRGDLDGDPAPEKVEVVRVDLEGVADPFDRTAVRVTDTCGTRSVTRRVAGPQDNLTRLRLMRVDPRPGREIVVDLRSGSSGRLGEARVVAWRSTSSGCRRARPLFAYFGTRPTAAPRGATREVSFFRLRLREASRRHRGTELVLVERFLRRADPPCCGSILKTTLLRYSRARDRYVRLRTSVRR